MKAQCSGLVGTRILVSALGRAGEGLKAVSLSTHDAQNVLCYESGQEAWKPYAVPREVQGVRGPEKSLWV